MPSWWGVSLCGELFWGEGGETNFFRTAPESLFYRAAHAEGEGSFGAGGGADDAGAGFFGVGWHFGGDLGDGEEIGSGVGEVVYEGAWSSR
jgi:hypothetical protein